MLLLLSSITASAYTGHTAQVVFAYLDIRIYPLILRQPKIQIS